MCGYLRSKGYSVSRDKVGKSLQRVDPQNNALRRQDLVVRTNPKPYYASYYGHKLHIDQNEKLVDFGCTHILLSDGYSSRIVGYVSMPIKNPIAIYEVFRYYYITTPYCHTYSCVV